MQMWWMSLRVMSSITLLAFGSMSSALGSPGSEQSMPRHGPEFDVHFSAKEIESISINVSVSCATWADLAARQAKGSPSALFLLHFTGCEMVVK
jgi:hypothetical protein